MLPNVTDFPGATAIPGVTTLSKGLSGLRRRIAGDVPAEALESSTSHAPRTHFNGPISPHRRLSCGQVSLDTVKAVKDAAGTTVNDVVVALCTSAVRDYLIERDDLPSDPLLAMIPVSVRTEAEQGEFGNRVGTMIVEIPTNEKDPRKRLEKTHASLMSAKARHQAVPASLLTDGTAFIPPAVAALAARSTIELLSRTRPPLNLVISNVPGPRDPLFCAGAQLEALYPVSAILDGVGLNMTVMSYRDHMDFGIIADRDQVDDTWGLLDRTRDALDELERVLVGRKKRAAFQERRQAGREGQRQDVRIRRPSPALVIACLALFVSLGGVGYAAATGSIDSREIRNNTVRGKDVRNNGLSGRDIANASLSGADIKNGRLLGVDIEDESLTGSDVDERTLGKVPGAGLADAAAVAGSAGSLGGVRVVPFELPLGRTAATPVRASVGGLEVRAGCAGGDIDLVLVNRSGAQALLTYDNTNEALDPNESVNVGDIPADDGADSGQAGFVVNSTGRTVRVQWSLAENQLGFDCYLSGLVVGYPGALRLPAALRGRQPLLRLDRRRRAPARGPPRGQGQPLHPQPPAGGARARDRGGRPLGGAARGSADQAAARGSREARRWLAGPRSKTTAWRTHSPAARRSKPSLSSSSAQAVGEQALHRQPPLEVQVHEARHVHRRVARAQVGALQRALLGHQRHRRDRQLLVGVREPDGHGGPAAAGGRVGVGQHLLAAHRLQRVVGAEAVGGLPDLLDHVVAGEHGVGGAQLPGQVELVGDAIDGHQRARPGQPRAQQRRQAHAAQAEHRHALAGVDVGRVDHGAHAGQHRAAEQRGDLEGQAVGHLHRRVGAHHDVLGEGRHAQVVVQRPPPLAPAVLARRAACRRRWPCRPARTARRARRGTRGTRRRWGRRRATRGRPGSKPCASGPSSTTSPAASWPEHHRHHARARAVDHRQVGVAQARGPHLDQHLPRSRRRQLELGHLQRPRLRVGRRQRPSR